MSATPSHHIVPEMYLKGFYDAAKVAVNQHVLWLYRPNKRIKPRGAHAVAKEAGFNRDPEVLGDKAEEAYAFAETAATPVLKNLRAGELLTSDEKEVMAFFIALQKFRTRLHREILHQAAIAEFRQTCRRMLAENRVHELVGTSEAERSGQVEFSLADAEKFVTDMSNGTIELEATGKGWAIAHALEGGQALAPLLARMRWTLLEAPPQQPWITTDNPVLLFEPFPVRPCKELYGPSLQMVFPVSPRFFLFGEPRAKGTVDDRGRAAPPTVRMFNEDILAGAHREVYASVFSKALQARVNRVFHEREPGGTLKQFARKTS